MWLFFYFRISLYTHNLNSMPMCYKNNQKKPIFDQNLRLAKI